MRDREREGVVGGNWRRWELHELALFKSIQADWLNWDQGQSQDGDWVRVWVWLYCW